MAWAKNGSTTLSGTSDTITVSSLTANKCNQFVCHNLQTGGYPEVTLRLGYGSVDSGSNYARRYSYNGGADATTSGSNVRLINAVDTNVAFSVGYFVNIASEEKLLITFSGHANATGAGSAPAREEMVGKWINTSNQSDIIHVYNSNTGDFDTGSNLSVLGSELTPASAIAPETNSIFIETDSAVRYWFDGNNWKNDLQLNNYGYEDSQSTASSRSLTFTVGAGSNRLLLVFVSGGGATLGVTSVTYGSQSLTKIADGTSGSPYYHDMELWGLVNPNVGTYSVTATQSGNTNMAIHDIISFYGAKQSLPTVYGTNSGNSSNISHNITPTATGSWVIGALYGGSLVSSSYFSTAELQVLVSTRSFNLTGLKTNPTIGSANTIQWTLSGAQPYTSIAVAVEPIT